MLVGEVSCCHLDQVGMIDEAQEVELPLCTVPSHRQWEELGSINLLCGFVKTLMDDTESSSELQEARESAREREREREKEREREREENLKKVETCMYIFLSLPHFAICCTSV